MKNTVWVIIEKSKAEQAQDGIRFKAFPCGVEGDGVLEKALSMFEDENYRIAIEK